MLVVLALPTNVNKINFIIMKITVKNSWDDITLSELERISLLNEIKLPEDLKAVELISILSDIPTDEIMKISATDLMKIYGELSFLSTDIPKKVINPIWEFDGNKYYHVLNTQEITTAQFLDYKIILQRKEIDKQLARLIACFTIPKGCKYSQGYDNEELVNLIYEHMTVVEASSLVDFFTQQFLAYSEIIRKSSVKVLTKELRKATTFKRKREIVTMIHLMENLKHSLKHFSR